MAKSNERFNIKVPLGDAEHKSEEKGSTKYVKRALANLKGTKPKRTGIVFWRKTHYLATEIQDHPGSFVVSRKAKASETPEKAEPKKATPKGKATTTAKKKGAKARASKGKSTKKEGVRRAA
jgi:hypothetical protein